MTHTPQDPDPVEIEIFRYAVESIVDEIDIAITRTAYTPLVYEYKDFCAGVLTSDFRLLGQSQSNLPIFLADLGEPVRDAVAIIGAGELAPGDVLLTNYGKVSGQHLNNMIAATPVYGAAGALAGYVAIRTHWPDVGGSTPGSLGWGARSVLQEGFQLRGLRILRGGRIVPEALATIQANTYMPEMVTGDLMSQTAACVLAARRWTERIAARWTDGQVQDFAEAQLAASARLAARRVAELPDGEYEASCWTDDSGAPGTEPLKLTVRLIVEGERMTADLSGLPPQVAAPINAGRTGGATSAMRVAFKSLLVPEQQTDQGLFDPLTVSMPDGLLLSAVGDAPLAHWNTTMPSMVDLFLKAIGQRLPERVPAGHHGSMAGISVTGRRPDGTWVQYIDTGNGGFGASAHASGYGPLKTLMHGDNRGIPIELVESRHPIRYHGLRLRHDAGGRGRHRGGPGIERSFELLEPLTLNVGLDRTGDPPWGLTGGEPGKPGEITIKRPDDAEWTRLTKVSDLELPPGTLVRQLTAGGGGWGTPDTA
jgi:N-methylhydantoinase B